MAVINKPSDINKIWAASGDLLAPSDSKISTGWQVEIPPRQYFNYIDNKQDQGIAHINQMGIAVWDNTTEYQYNLTGIKSLCMGSDGTIYRTLQTHQNQDPTSSVGYWEVAFSSAGDFYTKTEADARYLRISNNLGDITNTATARTNLSVYSQAQTYTKTEVDAKTTVASTAQAQALSSNTVLVTPLRLTEAFKGANQSITAGSDGYQILPGGLIVQWGIVSTGAANPHTVTFPIPFPNGFLSASFTAVQSTAPGSVLGSIFGPSESEMTIDRRNSSTTAATTNGGRWIAFGF